MRASTSAADEIEAQLNELEYSRCDAAESDWSVLIIAREDLPKELHTRLLRFYRRDLSIATVLAYERCTEEHVCQHDYNVSLRHFPKTKPESSNVIDSICKGTPVSG
jgi:hypothetical protein